jgi:hypothetical protein
MARIHVSRLKSAKPVNCIIGRDQFPASLLLARQNHIPPIACDPHCTAEAGTEPIKQQIA